jgi:hypothetical protein
MSAECFLRVKCTKYRMSEFQLNREAAFVFPEFSPAVRKMPPPGNGEKKLTHPIGIACSRTACVRNQKSSNSSRESHD